MLAVVLLKEMWNCIWIQTRIRLFYSNC